MFATDTEVDRTYNRNGDLTPYALACGGVQSKGSATGVYCDLYEEHGVYHVRRFDNRPGSTKFRTAWEVFECLSAARAYYRSLPLH